MISFNKWQKVLFASILSIALWTFISVNTQIFETDGTFDYLTYITSYILVIGIWALIALKIDISERFRKGIAVALFCLTPFFCMQIGMILSGEAEYSFGIYFINILFYVAIMAVILAISRSMKWSAIITTVLGYTFNLASFIVNILRGTPLIPSDFLAIGTAMQVAENYTFQLSYPIIAATVIAIAVITMLTEFSFTPQFKRKNVIFPAAGCAVAFVFILSLSLVDYSESKMDVFDQYHANNTHGSLYSFYINARKMMLTKPDGYKDETAEKLLRKANEQQSIIDYDNIESKPNIIAIMNESFSDLKAAGNVQTSEEYMPFFDSMKKNTIKGELLVSPFGGYTCNTEFEFLTGLSMGVLPVGSTPYLQYVGKEYSFSLPNHLKELGYKSIAIHPYYGRCWNREKVYGLMGFDNFINIDNMSNYLEESEWEYVRNYLSDRTSYRALINQLETKSEDERLFLFNVTMQNHGGYTYEGSEFPTVTITNMRGQYKEAEQYLSLIKESDKAFKELIQYLKKYPEPTIVVMFGDHQPAIEEEFYEELFGKELKNMTVEELQLRYKIPFVIWSNFDIESKVDVRTSPNYLANLVCEAAGLPKSEIGTFIDEISADIPQINVMGHFNSDGIWCDRAESTPDVLKDYETVEYYMLKKKNK